MGPLYVVFRSSVTAVLTLIPLSLADDHGAVLVDMSVLSRSLSVLTLILLPSPANQNRTYDHMYNGDTFENGPPLLVALVAFVVQSTLAVRVRSMILRPMWKHTFSVVLFGFVCGILVPATRFAVRYLPLSLASSLLFRRADVRLRTGPHQ